MCIWLGNSVKGMRESGMNPNDKLASKGDNELEPWIHQNENSPEKHSNSAENR